MTPGAHIEVLVRGEWIAVEVTHVPTEDAAAYLGRCRDGKQLAWTADAEMRAGVGASVAERVELHRPSEIDALREQLAEADARTAAIDALGRRVAELQNAAIVKLEDRLADAQRVIASVESLASLAMHFGAELCKRLESSQEMREVWRNIAGAGFEANEMYVIGRRDGLRLGEHRDALVRDVLRAAEAMHTDGTRHEQCVFDDAVRAWIAAGRPGAGEEG